MRTANLIAPELKVSEHGGEGPVTLFDEDVRRLDVAVHDIERVDEREVHRQGVPKLAQRAQAFFLHLLAQLSMQVLESAQCEVGQLEREEPLLEPKAIALIGEEEPLQIEHSCDVF